MRQLTYGVFAVFGIIILFFAFLLVRQTSLTNNAAQAILETEYRSRIINTPAESYLRYVGITPYKAVVGERLLFVSSRVATETFPASYLDELNCRGESGEPYYKAYATVGNVVSTDNEIETTTPWPFDFVPLEPMDCTMESSICFSIDGISKCTFFESQFSVPFEP